MLDRDTPRIKAVVLHPRFANARADDADYDLEEAIGLTEALDADCVASRIVPIRDLKVRRYRLFSNAILSVFGNAKSLTVRVLS